MTDADHPFYVYVLCRPCGTPFYIGMGSGKRIDHHELMARRGQRSHRANVIRKIWASGGRVIRRILCRFATDAEAKEIERYLIGAIGRVDLKTGPLINRTAGGDGVTGWSDEMRVQHRALTSDGMRRPEVQEKCRINIKRQWANPLLAKKMNIVERYWGRKDARELQAARVKAELSDPKKRATRAAQIAAALARPNSKAKMSAAAKQRMAAPGRREAHSAMMRELWKRPGFAEKRRATFAAKKAAKSLRPKQLSLGL